MKTAYLLLLFLIVWSSANLSDTVDRPIPVNATIPAYPPMAMAKRISGVVLVDVSVNEAGEPINAIAIIGEEYLRDAATKAALRWRFKPFKSMSNPYTVRLTFVFHAFSYKPPEKAPDFRSPYQIEILYPDITADCFNKC